MQAIAQNEMLDGISTEPLLNFCTNCPNTIMVSLAEQPVKILCNQVELKSVTLPDNFRCNSWRGFEHRVMWQLIFLSDEPHQFIGCWRDLGYVLPTVSSLKHN